MTISKKLFLMTALALNLGSLLNGSIDYQDQQIFNFAVTLSKQDDNNSKEVSQWLFEQTANNDFDTSKVSLIINAPLTLEEKVNRLAQIKPGLIKKYIITPLNIISPTVKKGIAISVTATVIIAAAAILPALTTFSTDMGSFAAKEYISYISNPSWYHFHGVFGAKK